MPDDQGNARIQDFIARLTEALGPKGVSTDAHEIEPHVQDWRGRWTGSTPVLVKPASTEEVSKAMTLCAEYGLAVKPQGGNSGMVNGSVPQGEVLISLKRMNRVREVDALNDAMTLEAGVILTRAQEVADENGRLFPLSLGAEGHRDHRRADLDQCGRCRGAALRHDARPGAGHRGGAAGRAGVERAAGAAEGQYRLRPQAAVHRGGGDAGAGDGGDAEAVPEAGREGDRLGGGREPGDRRWSCWRRRRRHRAGR